MKLQPVDFFLGVADDAIGRVAGMRELGEARRQRFDAIAVTHPNVERLAGLEARQNSFRAIDGDARCAVFAFVGACDLSAEQMRGQLQAVTNPQNGNAELEDLRIDQR